MTATEIYESVKDELQYANVSGNISYIVFLTKHLCAAQEEIIRDQLSGI